MTLVGVNMKEVEDILRGGDLCFSLRRRKHNAHSKEYTRTYSVLGSPDSLLCPELWAPKEQMGLKDQIENGCEGPGGLATWPHAVSPQRFLDRGIQAQREVGATTGNRHDGLDHSFLQPLP